MTRKVLLDTGPLVALVNRRDRYHAWVREQVAELVPPLFTCEAVLTEACHWLRKCRPGPLAAAKDQNDDRSTIA